MTKARMTEQDWLTTIEPYDLTHHKACRNDRKRRLLACAIARYVLPLIPDERYEPAIELAERFADGVATDLEVRAGRRTLKKVWDQRDFNESGNHATGAIVATLNKEAVLAVHGWEAAAAAHASLTRPNWDRGRDAAKTNICALARDVFGNPFRPVTLEPAWLTANVLAIAQAAYEERQLPSGTLDSTSLAVLADALEEAGCDNADVLAHCRQPGTHVRGCWVVDLVSARS